MKKPTSIQMIGIVIGCLAGWGVATGCANAIKSDSLQIGTNSGDTAQTVCTNPRLQVCTMDYRPVCGRIEDGSSKTYSNGCTACSDVTVTSHTEGPCKE